MIQFPMIELFDNKVYQKKNLNWDAAFPNASIDS